MSGSRRAAAFHRFRPVSQSFVPKSAPKMSLLRPHRRRPYCGVLGCAGRRVGGGVCVRRDRREAAAVDPIRRLPGTGYDPDMRWGKSVAAVAALVVGLGLSAGTASAGPFCYETGPGFEKCLSSPSGDYFNPIYQGPMLPDGYVPWSPPAPPAP